MILLATCIAGTGCVHRIQVTPLPTSTSAVIIPRPLQAIIGPLAMEGPDHRPGIALLEWSHRDFQQAVLRYLEYRGIFASVSTDPADLTLRVATKLSLTSRQGRYHYRILLQAEMSETGRFIKSYHTEQTAAGSLVRWIPASDRTPIETALQTALEDLMKRIETDLPLYLNRAEQPARELSPEHGSRKP